MRADLTAGAARQATQVMKWCDDLARISSDPQGLSRFYLTPEHRRCNDQVARWMQQIGMETWEDQAGNLWGRHAAADEAPRPVRAMILGSHLDSVPNGGRYDGPLGVLCGLGVVAVLVEHGIRLPFHLDVVGFGDEEGGRFGTALFGSRAVAGTWNSDWWGLEDSDGVSLQQAFEAFGLDPSRIGDCARDPDELMGYLELHIEQGPVLEQGGHPLGIVTGIAGARRFRVEMVGCAGHAGTVPMAMRQDAFLGASEAALLVERVARDQSVVATVGRLECSPGAVNVIPGQVSWTLDIRADDDERRDQALEQIRCGVEAICSNRKLSARWEETHSAPAVDCSPRLRRWQRAALESIGLEPVELMSGAGHDAMAIASVTDIAMYFIPCLGGVSHHPDESVMESDVVWSINAMVQTLVDARKDQGLGK